MVILLKRLASLVSFKRRTGFINADSICLEDVDSKLSSRDRKLLDTYNIEKLILAECYVWDYYRNEAELAFVLGKKVKDAFPYKLIDGSGYKHCVPKRYFYTAGIVQAKMTIFKT